MSDGVTKSEIVIAKILEKLLQNGLRDGWILNFQDLGLSDDYSDHFSACAKWLVAEEIIRIQGISEYINGMSRVIGPNLTAKGFALLGQSFSVAGQTVSASEIVKDKASGQANYAPFGDLLGGILGGFTKTIGS